MKPADTMMIAPCGMNCGLCIAHMREKNICPGCRRDDRSKCKTRVRCIIKNCEHITAGNSGYCYDCDKFPCLRLSQLDKRYRTKYSMSMIDNLEYIKKYGISAFINREKKKWVCSRCDSVISVHRDNCLSCGNKWR